MRRIKEYGLKQILFLNKRLEDKQKREIQYKIHSSTQKQTALYKIRLLQLKIPDSRVNHLQ